MPSIINGLFAGRSGIASHGTAIAVVGDNISNASTIGFKSARAEFEDLIAGGNTAGKTVGSGSSISAVSTIFEQGTLEFTGKPLDLAIDGNGFFVVADGDQKFYTRAGNFRVDPAGYIVNPNDQALLGFPSGGSGALEPLNVNTVSQDSVATSEVAITGNLDARAPAIALASIPAALPAGTIAPEPNVTFADLTDAAEFQTVVQVFDTLGEAHEVTVFFFKTDANEYTARAYVSSEDVDNSGLTGIPRQIGGADVTMTFNASGARTGFTSPDLSATIPWTNGSDATKAVEFDLNPFTQFAAPSNVISITQDGQGIGTVTSLNINKDGTMFALLSNGQKAIIGEVGLANFSNPEGLVRLGGQNLQQSASSGEPVIGRPGSGTFGEVQAGSVELSTVDIANEFVKLITLQRGFQASSRIITTINQLLNDIIQLA